MGSPGAQGWAVGKPEARGLTGEGIRGRPGPRGRAPRPACLPPAPVRPGAGPGRRPKLVKNPAVSESSSFPTSERQTSPLLLYYNAEPDGLLGVAPPRPPPPPSFIQSQTPALMPRGGPRHASLAARPRSVGTAGEREPTAPRREGLGNPRTGELGRGGEGCVLARPGREGSRVRG